MNVMKRAWVIAKDAAGRFGGKAKEYMSAALRQAWAEYKMISKMVTIEIPSGRTYVARITGAHPVYKLARTFLNPDEEGRYGEKIYHLTEGYYEINNGRRKVLVKIENGQEIAVNASEVLASVA